MSAIHRQRSPHAAGFEKTCLGGHVNNTSSGCSSQDADREQCIDRLRLELIGATDSSARREKWNRLKAEIASRSPAMIAKLERARGLRR